MNNDDIKRIALENGFKLKEQSGGELDLNPYVYDFARALIDASGTDRDLHRQHIANMVCDRLPLSFVPEKVDLSSMLVAVRDLAYERQNLFECLEHADQAAVADVPNGRQYIAAERKRNDELQKQLKEKGDRIAQQVCDRLPNTMVPKEVNVSSMLTAVQRLKSDWSALDHIVSELRHGLPELNKSRELAMNHTVAAPFPWCGDFGGMAQTLDYIIQRLEYAETEPATSTPDLSLTALRQRLSKLSDEMRATAEQMKYIGGFNSNMNDRATELTNASWMVTEWSNVIEQEAAQ